MAVSQRPIETTSSHSVPLRPHLSGARLSVVLLSTGSLPELEAAVASLSSRLHRFDAQLVVVRPGAESAELEGLLEYPRATFVTAPAGASRSQLCDLGMTRASGDIVALREARNVRDGEWLDSFSSTVPVADRVSDQISERVVVNWDQVASLGATPLADVLQTPARSREPEFPPALSGPSDVSLAPLPVA